MTALLKVRYVSFNAPPPPVRPPPVAEAPPLRVSLPCSESRDLVVTRPAKIELVEQREITPGPKIAYCEPAKLLTPPDIAAPIVNVPPVAHGTALPQFSGRSRVPGML